MPNARRTEVNPLGVAPPEVWALWDGETLLEVDDGILCFSDQMTAESAAAIRSTEYGCLLSAILIAPKPTIGVARELVELVCVELLGVQFSALITRGLDGSAPRLRCYDQAAAARRRCVDAVLLADAFDREMAARGSATRAVRI